MIRKIGIWRVDKTQPAAKAIEATYPLTMLVCSIEAELSDLVDYVDPKHMHIARAKYKRLGELLREVEKHTAGKGEQDV